MLPGMGLMKAGTMLQRTNQALRSEQTACEICYGHFGRLEASWPLNDPKNSG
jgi:hypothetical protein